MGYACPVCDLPQRDGEHLAHHLAFTAMLHGDEHEAWLDDHVDAWSERTPAELSDDVTPHAEAVETEDGDGHDHGHGRGEDHGHDHGREPGRPDVGPLGGGAAGLDAGGTGRNAAGAAGAPGGDDPEVQRVLQEARELTERMLDDGDESDGDAAGTEDDA